MLCLSALLSLTLPALQTDWPRFRGEDGTGVLAERSFPAHWGAEENLAWSAEVPGEGWSSPVVVGSRVFVTTAVRADAKKPQGFAGGVSDPMSRGGSGAKPTEEVIFQVHCLSLDSGDELWSRDVGALVPEYSVHPSNTYATESPTSDGERLFVTFGALGETVCYDLEGEEVWRVETGVYKTGNDFGWGISLVSDGERVFVQNDNEESSFLAALDGATGAEQWRAERAKGSSWGTPVLWQREKRPQIVACGPDTVVAYAPTTGDELWRVQGIRGSFSSSPTLDAERLYFGNSGPMSRGPLIAVPTDIEGTHDLRGEETAPVEWKADRAGPGFASPVVRDRFLYVTASGGILALHDAWTGERLWRERLPDAGTIVASPWIAGEELFILDENGNTYVVAVAEQFELLRVNELKGLYWSTPSVAGDALLLRASDRLHCIRE